MFEAQRILAAAVDQIIGDLAMVEELTGHELCIHQQLGEALLRGMQLAIAEPQYSERLAVGIGEANGYSAEHQYVAQITALQRWVAQHPLPAAAGTQRPRRFRRTRLCQSSPYWQLRVATRGDSEEEHGEESSPA